MSVFFSPKVSVIVPCFNAEKTIERCIKSIINQTYRNFNIIIVDDCSTDNSVSIIRQSIVYFHCKIRLISSKKNVGPSLARRIGILESNSDYLMFCDSDRKSVV